MSRCFLSIVLFVLMQGVSLYGESFHKNDSLYTRSLAEVEVEASLVDQKNTSVQRIALDEIQRSSAVQISDLLKSFAGVEIKDFGGIGGLKTISVRSLGANHTAIAYNGIPVSDCQSGQIDLGRFSSSQLSSLSLFVGQSEQLLQPVRLMAAGSVLQLESAEPLKNTTQKYGGSLSLRGGSFLFLNPSLDFSYRFHPRWVVQLQGEWISSKGDYPYLLEYGAKGDSVSSEKRTNTATQNFKTELHLFGNLQEKGYIKAQLYYYQSDREIPGAVVLYRPSTPQYLKEKHYFGQINYKTDITSSWSVRADGKFNGSFEHYKDPYSNSGPQGYENRFHQWEVYLSSGVQYTPLRGLSLAFNTDYAHQWMISESYQYQHPYRDTWLSSLGLQYRNSWVKASASVLSHLIWEHAEQGVNKGFINRVTPYVCADFQPFQQEDLHIRLMFKEAFRLPSFNDLYYEQVGNPRLRPERALQSDLGISWLKPFSHSLFSSFYLSGNLFWNSVQDKIIAVPSQNLFVWSMVNLGKVDIKGADLQAELKLSLYKNIDLSLKATYTYQHAVDVTSENDPVSSKVYGHQIAYTPRHSGSVAATLLTSYIDATYRLLISGERYKLGENVKQNRLSGYADHSLTFSKTYPVKAFKVGWKAEFLNLANVNYQVVQSFPMPGFQARATISFIY